VLTESGRQPWIVQGLMLTDAGLSTSVGALQVAISLTVFVLLYLVLGVVAAVLMLRHVRAGVAPDDPQASSYDPDDRAPALTY
jgi:cytochrome d ubiquinol oxidase subunit I